VLVLCWLDVVITYLAVAVALLTLAAFGPLGSELLLVHTELERQLQLFLLCVCVCVYMCICVYAFFMCACVCVRMCVYIYVRVKKEDGFILLFTKLWFLGVLTPRGFTKVREIVVAAAARS
jgi:hypothetical protein